MEYEKEFNNCIINDENRKMELEQKNERRNET